MKRSFFNLLILSAITIGWNSCADTDEPPLVEIIDLNAIPTKGAADAKTSFTITAAIPKEAAKDKRTIKFSTSGGTFKANGTQELEVMADISSSENKLVAEAILVASGSAGMAEVNARILDYADTIKVEFEKIDPVAIRLTNNVPAISGNNSANHPTEVFLEATLAASTGGIASSGVAVNFMVFDDDSSDNLSAQARWRLKQSKSNSSGKVSGFLFAGNLDPMPKTLRIIFEVEKNPDLRDTVFVDVF